MGRKSLIKLARDALLSKDFEGAIDYCDEALEKDKDDYYALLFKGKALFLEDRKNLQDATKLYKLACKVRPFDGSAWKGLIELDMETDNYKSFFEDVLGLAKALQAQEQNLRQCVDNVDRYIQKHSKNGNSNDALHEYYYKQMIPGLSELGDFIGPMSGNPIPKLDKLITLTVKKEQANIKKKLDKLKFKMPAHITSENKKVLDSAEYSIYEHSELPKLYNMALDFDISDSLRAIYEEQLLKYRYQMLLVAPDKKQAFKDTYEMVSDMVLVHTHCKLAYDLYFDWIDFAQLEDMDLKVIVEYLRSFGISGLGAILYAYVLSEISPFDRRAFQEDMSDDKGRKNKRKKRNEKKKGKNKGKREVTKDNAEAQDKAGEKDGSSKDGPGKDGPSKDGQSKDGQSKDGQEKGDQDKSSDDSKNNDNEKDDSQILSNDEALDLMMAGIRIAKQSILAHRILINFCIHMKNYQEALDYSRECVKITLGHSKAIGVPLPHSRLHSLLDLAIIYTYHESPKNFPKAMELYSSVLKSDPKNIQAKVGKGLIYVENGDYEKAAGFLKDAVNENTDNYDACHEYGWCLIQLGHREEGRKWTKKAMKMVSGTDASSLNKRAVALWRIGQSYLLECEEEEEKGEKNEDENNSVRLAFQYFVESLKQSSSYPPCYTSLGWLLLKVYHNATKALKCFYKAFELDPSELLACHELVKHFSSKKDWEMVEVICTRVIGHERARKMLLSKDIEDASWPYRMLGCSSMEKGDDSTAIGYFQNALRIAPGDISAWVGLGEAYVNGGRLEASTKVFKHVLEISPGDWYAQYLLAVTYKSMLRYQEALEQLEVLSQGKHSDEKCVLTALYETLVARASHEVSSGFVGRSKDTVKQAIDALKLAHAVDSTSQKLWKAVQEVLTLCFTVQSNSRGVSFDALEKIIEDTARSQQFVESEFMSQVNQMDQLDRFDMEESRGQNEIVNILHYYDVMAAKNALRVLPSTAVKPMRAGLLYNLAVAYLYWRQSTGSDIYRDCAIYTLRKAVQLESGNPEFWCTLGVASMSRNARASQHCFIKAVSLAPTATTVWIGLGVLYLTYQDFELAQKCFSRAQSLGPSTPNAWTGQALVFDGLQDGEKAGSLFTHSYVLSNGHVPLNGLLYGLSIVQKRIGSSPKEHDLAAVQDFNSAHVGLLRYLKFYPRDALALQLALAVIERIHAFDEGIKMSQQLCGLLEKEAEKSEQREADKTNEAVLISYARAQAQLARLYLGAGKYPEAIKAGDTASEILAEDDNLTTGSQKCLMSSLAVSGLSLYFSGEFEKSLEQLNKVLEVFPDSRRVVVLVAQVLHTFGEEDTKQAAVEELMKSIESYGTSLLVALTLASIAIVDRLDDYLPAVREELQLMPAEMKIADISCEIPYFVDQINKCLGEDTGSKLWQRSAFLFPAESAIWKHLDSHVALNVACESKNIDSGVLAESYIKAGTLREIQRGIFLDPANIEGFRALQGCFE